MDDEFGIWFAGEPKRSIPAKVLMHASNLISVCVEVRDILATCTARLICQRRGWMRVSENSCGEVSLLKPLPELLAIEDPSHLSRADVPPLRGLTHADIP